MIGTDISNNTQDVTLKFNMDQVERDGTLTGLDIIDFVAPKTYLTLTGNLNNYVVNWKDGNDTSNVDISDNDYADDAWTFLGIDISSQPINKDDMTVQDASGNDWTVSFTVDPSGLSNVADQVTHNSTVDIGIISVTADDYVNHDGVVLVNNFTGAISWRFQVNAHLQANGTVKYDYTRYEEENSNSKTFVADASLDHVLFEQRLYKSVIWNESLNGNTDMTTSGTTTQTPAEAEANTNLTNNGEASTGLDGDIFKITYDGADVSGASTFMTNSMNTELSNYQDQPLVTNLSASLNAITDVSNESQFSKFAYQNDASAGIVFQPDDMVWIYDSANSRLAYKDITLDMNNVTNPSNSGDNMLSTRFYAQFKQEAYQG
jgi:hypothetical protein